MTSPARLHYLRKMAALQAGVAAVAAGAPLPPTEGPQADDYQLLELHLRTDIAALKELQSIEKRIERKRELLPKYEAWVEGRIEAPDANVRGVQDDVLVTIMLWRIDVGDYAGAVRLAQYAVRHHLAMPQGFSRGLPCVLAEQVAEGAIKDLAAGKPAPDVLDDVFLLVDGHDMPDEVKAKLHKAIGLEAARRAGDEAACAASGVPNAARIFRERALAELKRAVDLHEACGVKTDIKRLEKELNKPAPAGDETASQAQA